MKALGIIAEYNPFHNGHLYHLKAAKQLTERAFTIAVMSGNFVQRGEPALCDKWRRTRMALTHGVDMVIELPVYFATAAAEHFARAAVQLLHASGMVDTLCFGSESGDINAIAQTGRILADEPPAFKNALRHYLSAGLSFPSARAKALDELTHTPEGLLTLPNNGLGIEYCKILHGLSSAIAPYTVRREAGGPSATVLREAFFTGQTDRIKDQVPEAIYPLLTELAARGEAGRLDAYSDIFHYLLRTLPPEAIRAAADMSEGLENRFHRYAGEYHSLSALLAAVKTKRYTLTRLRRAALHVVLGITNEAVNAYEAAGGPQYIRVLGFRRDSASLLREMQAAATLPVVTNLKQASRILSESAMRMLKKEIETTDLYTLAGKQGLRGVGYEYTMPLVIV